MTEDGGDTLLMTQAEDGHDACPPCDDVAGIDAAVVVEAAAAGRDAAPRVPFYRRLTRGRWASVVSLVAALAVHAAVIGAGVYYYRTFVRDRPPVLLVPQGVTTEVAGSGEVSAQLAEVTIPRDLAAPDAAAAAAASSKSAPTDTFKPPSEIETPDVAPPAVVLDANAGTSSDFGPLPTFSANRSPPVVGPRFPPGYRPDADGTDQGSQKSAPATDNRAANGAPAAGANTGGAPQGVPEGLPVPSPHNDQPIYPEVALRNGWGGVVRVELVIDPNGRVSNVRVVTSSGHRELDDSAVAKLKTWSFAPATLNGQPLASTVTVPVNFTPHDSRRH